MKKIACTIGILTYNSEEHLARCLESVKDFAEIIIADGGSTDKTLEIAKAYGCRVIAQSNPGKRITDFARERNILLQAAHEPWFFYLDTDETMSSELRDAIRELSSKDTKYGAYKVRYCKTSADMSQVYRTYKEYYQVRLTRTDIGATFVRPIHERIIVPNTVMIGQLEGPWYVPFEKHDLEFRYFAKKVWYRLGIQASMWQPRGIVDYVRQIIVAPAVLTAKSLYKMIMVKIKYGKDGIPMRYELLRIVSNCILMIQYLRVAIKRSFTWIRNSIKELLLWFAYIVSCITVPFRSYKQVYVLMYHSVGNGTWKHTISPKEFARQLEYLNNKYHIVPLADIVAYSRKEKDISDKSVAITFDDGYEDFYEYVFPLIKQYQVPCTIFLTTNLERQEKMQYLPRLTWQQIIEMQSTGLVTFEVHGHNHIRLDTISQDPQKLDEELLTCRTLIHEHTGYISKIAAYPFGYKNDALFAQLEARGFIGACGIREGIVYPGDNPYLVKRVQVDKTHNIRMFKLRLTPAITISRAFVDTLRRKN